mmetsp:Transcript_8267/g.16698  ORF Transcript_8267/g.16698 Transcript_8267/m.16698 type:complete len:119 (+) Transcript_8267:529-885(+)
MIRGITDFTANPGPVRPMAFTSSSHCWRNAGMSNMMTEISATMNCDMIRKSNMALTPLRVFVVLQIEEFLFKFATHRNNLSSAMLVYPILNFRQPLGSLSQEILFRHVDNINLRLGGD